MKKMIFACCTLYVFNISASTSDVEESIKEVVGKLEILEKTVAEQEKRIIDLEEKLKAKASEDSAKKESELIAGKSPQDIIKIAAGIIEENNTDEARHMLNLFVEKNPQSEYCGMALFYIGNTYFVEKEYKKAAETYMVSYAANAKGAKSAECLYKLALCFSNLSEFEKSSKTLSKLIEDYPGCEFAEKASAKIKEISAKNVAALKHATKAST